MFVPAAMSFVRLQDGASDQEVCIFMRKSWGTSVSSSARSSAADVYNVPALAVFEGDSSLCSSACSSASSSRRSSWAQFDLQEDDDDSQASFESSVEPVPVTVVKPLPQGRALTVQQVAAYLPAGSSEADFQLERVRIELAAKRQQVDQVGSARG